MSTTRRHNKIINEFVSMRENLNKAENIDIFTSDCALAHWGSKRKSNDICKLVDFDLIEDREYFKKRTINQLEYVQPDYMLFKNNISLVNEFETITAGFPDLVIEIWSDSNSEAEKKFKFDLYSSGSTCEHWYITQDSNNVECFMGENRLNGQNLKNILTTDNGIKFDLRRIAI
ncbi:MAG: Uma2 family endonuclease [Oscillospiraceae bacterium]|nr:Uma2 family endonuclease [Oscillospiraceae bacterium]